MNRSPFQRHRASYGVTSQGDEAEIHVYDEIGFWGITARDFVRDLKQITAGTIHLRVNSPGGDVFDGVAMYNALKEHPARVVTHIDGLAASIASVIALAGDEVQIADNAFFMIHHPWTIAIGNAAELRKGADTLDKIAESIITTYLHRADASREVVETWMDEETWFNAEEAVEHGFADAIAGEATKAKASFDLSVFSRVPDALKAGAHPTKRDLERTLRDAGYSRSEAKAIVAAATQAPSLRDADEDGLITATDSLVATINRVMR